MWRWKCSQPWLRTLPPPHSYGNQKLQRQFDGLLMMGIVMPKICWAVIVRQGNKFYDWLLHLVGCFIQEKSDGRCMRHVWGRRRIYVEFWWGNQKKKSQTQTLWENNIKINIREIGLKGTDRIHMAHKVISD